MHSDKIIIKNMVFYAYHGAFSAERELGQKFEVDVELHGDFEECAKTDDLDLAVNYADVYAQVKDIVEEREFNLIETLARTIADEILSACSVDEVVVRVRKPGAPIGGPVDYVEVEMTREAQDGRDGLSGIDESAL